MAVVVTVSEPWTTRPRGPTGPADVAEELLFTE